MRDCLDIRILVSLFPEKIIRDLGLRLECDAVHGSFTPYLKTGRTTVCY